MSMPPVMFGAPKDSAAPSKILPAGRYTVRLDGFKPKMSKNKDKPSVNLFPQLVVINHPTFNGEKIFNPLNQGAGFIMKAFTHMFGLEVVTSGDSIAIPGGFIPDPLDKDNVSKMTYQGPLSGMTGELELAVGADDKGRPRNIIKQYFCRLPGCKEEHPTELT